MTVDAVVVASACAALLAVALVAWRLRAGRRRAFRDAASATCRPGRWRPDDDGSPPESQR